MAMTQSNTAPSGVKPMRNRCERGSLIELYQETIASPPVQKRKNAGIWSLSLFGIMVPQNGRYDGRERRAGRDLGKFQELHNHPTKRKNGGQTLGGNAENVELVVAVRGREEKGNAHHAGERKHAAISQVHRQSNEQHQAA
ncbi:hypothetical protein Q3G72_005139 [Acer saccharum]|nr:hypothetical protein Q3G72_005139 [Acer saccharum]